MANPEWWDTVPYDKQLSQELKNDGAVQTQKETEKRYGSALNGRLSDVTYDAVATQNMENPKRQAILAVKEAYAREKELMDEIQKTAEKDAKDEKNGQLYWRKGLAGQKDELGDFIRDDIMSGPYASRKESDEMPSMNDRNEKTRAMYQRYFNAKAAPEGLDSDPVIKVWVEKGDRKKEAIVRQVSASNSAATFDQAAHMAHMNKQRGR